MNKLEARTHGACTIAPFGVSYKAMRSGAPSAWPSELVCAARHSKSGFIARAGKDENITHLALPTVSPIGSIMPNNSAESVKAIASHSAKVLLSNTLLQMIRVMLEPKKI